MRNNGFVVAVFHEKAFRDLAQGCETKASIELEGSVVGFNDGVELKDFKPNPTRLLDTVQHKPFADSFAAVAFFYGIAGIAEVSASTDVIGMQDI